MQDSSAIVYTSNIQVSKSELIPAFPLGSKRVKATFKKLYFILQLAQQSGLCAGDTELSESSRGIFPFSDTTSGLCTWT